MFSAKREHLPLLMPSAAVSKGQRNILKEGNATAVGCVKLASVAAPYMLCSYYPKELNPPARVRDSLNLGKHNPSFPSRDVSDLEVY